MGLSGNGAEVRTLFDENNGRQVASKRSLCTLFDSTGLSDLFAAGVNHTPAGRHPIIPLFHHSIILIVSEAN